MSTNTIEINQSKASTANAALLACRASNLTRAKIWTSSDLQVTRIYTGERGEYLTIEAGKVLFCKPRLTWGAELRDALKIAGIAYQL